MGYIFFTRVACNILYNFSSTLFSLINSFLYRIFVGGECRRVVIPGNSRGSTVGFFRPRETCGHIIIIIPRSYLGLPSRGGGWLYRGFSRGRSRGKKTAAGPQEFQRFFAAAPRVFPAVSKKTAARPREKNAGIPAVYSAGPRVFPRFPKNRSGTTGQRETNCRGNKTSGIPAE